MSFSLDPTKLARIDDGLPALASDVNALFSQIETELNGVTNVADDAIGSTQLRTDSVTSSKIDLSGFTPSAANDPITKTYMESYIDSQQTELYGLQAITTKDENLDAFSYDKYNSTSEVITQKMYKANADGYLTVICRVLSNTGVVSNDYYGRLVIWAGDSPLTDYSLTDINFSDVDKDEWIATNEPKNSGAFVRYDNYFRGGPVTAIVPIKKDEYFKIMPVRKNSSNSLFQNTNGVTEYVAVYIKWNGISSNNRPEVI